MTLFTLQPCGSEPRPGQSILTSKCGPTRLATRLALFLVLGLEIERIAKITSTELNKHTRRSKNAIHK